jgi:hypothetical protein
MQMVQLKMESMQKGLQEWRMWGCNNNDPNIPWDKYCINSIFAEDEKTTA